MKYLGTTQEQNSFVTKDYVDEAIANVGGSYDDTPLREELAKKANEDGVYPQMTVGMTRDMLGVSEGAPAEFTFRPTDGDGSIKDGFASIERIEGNSVVWNNMVDTRDKVGQSGWTYENSYLRLVKGHRYALIRSAAVDTLYCIPIINEDWKYEYYLTQGNYATIFVSQYDSKPSSTRLYSAKESGACMVVDLTKMFGAGNEPLTIEEFYQRIPSGIDINAYNEGEVVDMRAEGIKSVGFNAWDEEWEIGTFNDNGEPITTPANNTIRCKNHIKILPNIAYYWNVPNVADGSYMGFAYYYDADGKYIGKAPIAGTYYKVVTTPSNAATMRFVLRLEYGTTYNHDVSINLVHTGYRNGEYEPYTSEEIALPTLNYFPQGMRSIGKVCDEITQKQTIQRIGAVDLGDLNFAYVLDRFVAEIPTMPNNGGLLCAIYNATTKTTDAPDMSIGNTLYYGYNAIAIRDSRYTDAASFKAAMKGVILYYELAEPIVTDIQEPLNLDYQVWDFGTEQAISSQKSTQFKGSIIYEFNARDTIRKNKHDIATLNAEILQLKSLVQEVTNNVGPYILKNTILDLDRAIRYYDGEQNISDIAEIRTALANHRAIHIKYGSNFDGYFVVNGYIDGTDMITLEFWFALTQYSIEIDTSSGIGYVSTYDA